MIRLIATDLDDTLLNEHSALNPRVLDALKTAMALGCGVCLSSGRMVEAMLPLANQIGVNAPMLLYNGALLYDHRSDETIYAPRIPYAVAQGIVDRVEALGYYIQLYPGKGYYCREIMDCTRRYAASIGVQATPVHMPMAQWLRENPSDMQKMLIIDTPEGADRVKALLCEEFPHGAAFMKSRAHYLEIAPEGVDKGSSLGRLAEHLGLTADEVLAFGDGQNDASMLAWTPNGYAMANACPEALAAAAHVAPSNLEDGVAQVIEAYIHNHQIGALPRRREEEA